MRGSALFLAPVRTKSASAASCLFWKGLVWNVSCHVYVCFAGFGGILNERSTMCLFCPNLDEQTSTCTPTNADPMFCSLPVLFWFPKIGWTLFYCVSAQNLKTQFAGHGSRPINAACGLNLAVSQRKNAWETLSKTNMHGCSWPWRTCAMPILRRCLPVCVQ